MCLNYTIKLNQKGKSQNNNFFLLVHDLKSNHKKTENIDN